MEQEDAQVKYQPEGRVAYITLDRPERRNALNAGMLDDFDRAVAAFASDPEARVAIIRGTGRDFCAGYDQSPARVAANHARNAVADRDRLHANVDRWLRLWDCPKPIIAQLHGNCLGGGSHMPILCDVVAIAEDATIGFPKLPLGAGLGAPGLSFLVGGRKAKELAFVVGSTMTGRQAYEYGYANMVFPREELAEKTRAYADAVAKQPADLLRISKLAINRAMELQGFRAAVLSGAEWDAIAHESPSVKEIQRWITELGLRAAIAKFSAEGL